MAGLSVYRWNHVSRAGLPGLSLLFLLLVYILFPSGFSSTDAWSYAAAARYGTDLARPFHLLYNPFGWTIFNVFSFTGIDALALLKVVNSFFAVASLYFLQLILKKYELSGNRLAIITILAGTSFGIMRYATENETYILPLFLGLGSSYFYLCYKLKGRVLHLFLTGLLASLAALFHLSYIIWWSVLLISIFIFARRKQDLFFLLSFLLLPVVYLLVISCAGNGPVVKSACDFFAMDAMGNLNFDPDGRSILLSVIGLVRSFIQVHGYMFGMVKGNILFLLPVIISVILVVFSIRRAGSITLKGRADTFINVHFVIFGINFLFAVISRGNAEFMVMLPVLLFMIIAIILEGGERSLSCLAAALLIWNLSYGIIPLHLARGESARYLLGKAQEKGNLVISSDDQLLKSINYYNTGKKDGITVLKSPAVLYMKRLDTSVLDSAIYDSHGRGIKVYTDCAENEAISRATILSGSKNKEYFSRFDKIVTGRWHELTGSTSVCLVKLPDSISR